MNRIVRMAWGMALVAVGLFVLNQGASAQRRGLTVPGQAAAAHGDCKEAKGNLYESWNGGADSPGTIKNGEWLDGVTDCVFNSAGFPTPVPTQFTYTCAYTITTGKGQLKGTRTFVTDVGPAGWSLDMTIIDSLASTGMFAGATGVVYSNGIQSNTASFPNTFLSEVSGQVCFAK